MTSPSNRTVRESCRDVVPAVEAVRCHPPEKAQSPTRIWLKDPKSPSRGAGGWCWQVPSCHPRCFRLTLAVRLQVSVGTSIFRPVVTFSVPVSGSLVLIYIVVGVVCTVLALLVAAVVYLIWAKQGKGKETERSFGGEAAAPDPLLLVSSISAGTPDPGCAAAAPAQRGGRSRAHRVVCRRWGKLYPVAAACRHLPRAE